MDYRSLSSGFSNILPYYVENDVIINVGPTETFTTVSAAIASISSTVFTGNILIKVADGEYVEPTIYLDNINLSGRLAIEGSVSNPIACKITFIPNPAIALKLSTLGDSVYSTTDVPDYTKVGYGIVVRNGFILRLSGFLLDGGLVSNNPAFITVAGLVSDENSSIISLDNSIKITNCLNGIIAQNNSSIYSKGIECYNIPGICVSVINRSIVNVDFANLHSSLNVSVPIISVSYLQSMHIHVQIPENSLFYNAGIVESIPFYVVDDSFLYIQFSNINGFTSGGVAANASNAILTSSFISNISKNYCLLAQSTSSIIAIRSSLMNVYMPSATGMSAINLNNLTEAVNIMPPTIISKSLYLVSGISGMIAPSTFNKGTASGAQDSTGSVFFYS